MTDERMSVQAVCFMCVLSGGCVSANMVADPLRLGGARTFAGSLVTAGYE